MFAEGTLLLPEPVACRAPASGDAYAAASRDLNSIHRSVHLAQLADLEKPIVHGMWTAALARSVPDWVPKKTQNKGGALGSL